MTKVKYSYLYLVRVIASFMVDPLFSFLSPSSLSLVFSLYVSIFIFFGAMIVEWKVGSWKLLFRACVYLPHPRSCLLHFVPILWEGL